MAGLRIVAVYFQLKYHTISRKAILLIYFPNMKITGQLEQPKRDRQLSIMLKSWRTSSVQQTMQHLGYLMCTCNLSERIPNPRTFSLSVLSILGRHKETVVTITSRLIADVSILLFIDSWWFQKHLFIFLKTASSYLFPLGSGSPFHLVFIASFSSGHSCKYLCHIFSLSFWMRRNS